MQNRDKPLVWLVIGLLFSAGMLLCLGASAQTMPGRDLPAFFNPDPSYWYNEYQSEHARAEGLAQSGKTAISGLQASLHEANETITQQNRTIAELVTDRDNATDRAVNAETALKPVTDERDRLKGKTKAGRLLRKARNGLAYVGGVVIFIATLKISL